MKNISELNAPKIKGVFTDIDDTVTLDGKLYAEGFNALWELKKQGFIVIPITGRPAGWCDHIARFWPVDGVVGENGAFYFRVDNQNFIRRFVLDDKTRNENRLKLEKASNEALVKWPFLKLASDQLYRECDLAIDYCEDVKEPLSEQTIKDMMDFFINKGAEAKLSSIHINTWFGKYDKLGACKLILKECFDIDLDKEKENFIYSGDSPNDEPMFEYFPNSVGVANVSKFVKHFTHLPKYITNHEGSYGFAEMVEKICSLKKQ